MEKIRVKDSVRSYFRKEAGWLLISAMTAIIFLFVFFVYNVKLESILYASLISALAALAVMSYQIYRYHKRNNQLAHILSTIRYELAPFAKPQELGEELYQDVISEIYQIRQEDRLRMEQNRLEVMEYYTMWVHQIKTPLAALRLLLQRMEGPKKTEMLAELFKIEQYVDMALQYLRIEDMADLVLKEIELQDVVRQAIRKHASWFISKNVTIQLKEFSCRVLSDTKWLGFAIDQLISNALKYTPSGGCITIDLADPDTLVIEDNGIGIAQEDLPRVFEKGYTGQNGRYDKKATGIGLYLVKKILHKLTHSIRIESEAGAGTKVYIHFERSDIKFE